MRLGLKRKKSGINTTLSAHTFLSAKISVLSEFLVFLMSFGAEVFSLSYVRCIFQNCLSWIVSKLVNGTIMSNVENRVMSIPDYFLFSMVRVYNYVTETELVTSHPALFHRCR